VPAALKHDMQRRLQDQVLFGSDYPGWSPGQCCDEWEMENFRDGVIEKLFHRNATRILKLEDAITKANAAAEAN
jgi:predicted TIM-barrel fold metal-dependent hydrolase